MRRASRHRKDSGGASNDDHRGRHADGQDIDTIRCVSPGAERARAQIGIRIALGAQLGRLLRSVMGGGLRLVAFGAIIGLCGAVALSRAMASLLFSVSPYDPLTYAAVLALLGAVGGRRRVRASPPGDQDPAADRASTGVAVLD